MFSTFLNKFLILVIISFFAGCSLKDIKKEKEKDIKKEKTLFKEPVTPLLVMNINEIISLIKNKDIKTLNDKYINKKYGYFDVYKSNNKIKYEKKFTINVLEKNYFSFANLINRSSLHLSPLKNYYAKFYCSPHDDAYYGWDKEGLFYTADLKFPLMQKLISEKKDFNEKYFAKLVDITSYRLVLSQAEIILFLSKENGNWFISLFDRASISCSSK